MDGIMFRLNQDLNAFAISPHFHCDTTKHQSNSVRKWRLVTSFLSYHGSLLTSESSRFQVGRPPFTGQAGKASMAGPAPLPTFCSERALLKKNKDRKSTRL